MIIKTVIFIFKEKKAKLRKRFFFAPSLSADGKISCASCHNPQYGTSDLRPVSIGVFGRKGKLQLATVYNAMFNFRQFWNGRANNLYKQIEETIHNLAKMGLSNEKVEKFLNNNSFYRNTFFQIYHVLFKDIIIEFKKAMVILNCKFDKYLRGEVNLTKEELKGYILFKKLGCITCHNGVNLGGNSFQKIGTIHPGKDRIGDRYEKTHNNEDKYVYKVSSLRNITLTALYFHTYNLKMAYLGIKLSQEKLDTIVAFLKTLTGKTPIILKKVK